MWNAFETPKVPSNLADAMSSLQDIVTTVTSVLDITKDLAQTLAQLEITRLDASQLAIRAALTALDQSIKALMSDTGVYVLFVPARKKIVIPAIVQSAMSKAGFSELPAPTITEQLFELESKLDGSISRIVRAAQTADGGNQGFIRSVIESLVDKNDANRPQPEDTDYVTGLYIVGGTSQFPGATSLASALSTLFGAGNPTSTLQTPGTPIPQNLRVRKVATGVQLEWNYHKPITTISNLSTSVLIDRIAIIRSTDASFTSITTAQNAFGTVNLTLGLSKGTSEDFTEVVGVLDYDLLAPPRLWLDTTTLDNTKNYYYGVCYSTRMGSEDEVSTGGGTSMGFGGLSNIVKTVPVVTPAKSVTSTPPDWTRTPSVISLLPDLAGPLKILSSQVTAMGSTGIGLGDTLKNYIKFLETEITQFQNNITQITDSFIRLSNLGSSIAGTYVRAFDGQGGVPFLVKDLVQSFGESNAPAFNGGDEFVAGIVLLAFAPSATTLTPIKTALNLLFGGAGAKEQSAIEAALAKIDVLLRDAEEEIVAVEVEMGQVRVGTDDDGSKDLNCPKIDDSTMSFNDDFTPKE